jgi:hypothetical protein
VLACDRIPAGLADLGHAFGQLSALAFRFQLVEITPWVRSGGEEIIFTNTTKARTEIVARSVVEVSWVGHAERPTVSVASTPLDDVEAALVSTRTPGGLKRTWSAQEIRQAIEEEAKLSPAKLACALRLLQFCVDHSAEGRITNQATVYPTFAFRIQGRSYRDGRRLSRPLWTVDTNYEYLYVMLENLPHLVESDAIEGLRERIGRTLRKACGPGDSYLSVRLDHLPEQVADLESLSLELQQHFAARQ